MQNDSGMAARSVQDNSRSGMIATWVIAVLLCAVSVPVVLATQSELAKGNTLVLLALVFPLTGVLLALYALRLTASHLRYGRLAFEPDPDPGMIGGIMGGRIQLPVRVAGEGEVELALTCVRTRVTERQDHDGNSTERTEKVIWQREGRPVVRSKAPGSLLLFRFAIPRELPPSDTDTTADGTHRWVLSLAVEMPGVSLQREFTVPIAREGTLPSAQIARLPEASGYGPAPQIPHEVLAISRDGEAIEFRYPPLRDRGSAVFFAVLGLIFIAAIWLFSAEQGRVTTTVNGLSRASTGGMPWLLSAVFIAAGLGLLLLAAFLLLNTLVVRVSASRLSAQRSVAGIGLWSRTLRREDIGDIVSEIGITSKGGRRPRVTYRLYAVPKERIGLASSAVMQARREGRSIGPRVLVGVSLKGSSMMERVRTELRKAIGLSRVA